MTIQTSKTPYLAGQLLVAMPNMPDPRFSKTVVYMCAHNEDGAMGLVINRDMPQVTLPDLLEQLGIDMVDSSEHIRIHSGGPVEAGRGFVLHSPDYVHETTLVVDGQVALTATVDVLKAIAQGRGPQQKLLALGYAGWGPGQLDTEILENGWLSVNVDQELLFSDNPDVKWEGALKLLGIEALMLSEEAGHA